MLVLSKCLIIRYQYKVFSIRKLQCSVFRMCAITEEMTNSYSVSLEGDWIFKSVKKELAKFYCITFFAS